MLTGDDLKILVKKCPNIYKLKLERNNIESIDKLKGLKELKLKKLYLKGNPLTSNNKNYKEEIYNLLETLESIDGTTKNGEEYETTYYGEEGDEITLEEEDDEKNDDNDYDGDDDNDDDDDDQNSEDEKTKKKTEKKVKSKEKNTKEKTKEENSKKNKSKGKNIKRNKSKEKNTKNTKYKEKNTKKFNYFLIFYD